MGRDAVVGRERELATVREFLEAEDGVLLLEGEAGIGKTTVWLAGVETARGRFSHVLVARPAEAETALPYAALSDLLEPVLDEALRSMPLPQRRALDVVLGRSEREMVSHSRVVAAAVLTALRTLAEDGPLLVAVDDVQWIDAASTEPLSYALRRLADETVAVLATRRTGISGGPTLREGRRVTIEPLPRDEIVRIVRTRLPLDVPSSALRRVAERSGGNPFFALELARDGRLVSDPDAPLPPSLDALLRDRVAAVPPDVRDALLVAAVHPSPAPELLERAGVGAAAVDGAVAGDLLVPAGDRLRFSHPLLAAAVLVRTSVARRRDAHGRLAAALDDADERALHLGLATAEPDETVAAELEDAAERVRRRGAPVDAAELAGHAVRLTSQEAVAALRRRTLLHGDLVGAAGEAARACEILFELAGVTPPGPERARVLLVLATWTYDPAEQVRHCEAALAEADERDRAQALLVLSTGLGASGRVDEAVRAIDAALPAAEASGDHETLALALVKRAWRHWCSGEGVSEELFLRADALLATHDQRVTSGVCPERELAEHLFLAGEHDRARPLYEKHLEIARELGDDWTRSYLLAELGALEARVGRAAEAESLVDEAVELARQVHDRFGVGNAIYWRARVRALLGQLDGARADAEDAIERIAEVELWRVCAVDVLGYVALTLGQLDIAADHLEHVLDRLHAYPWREPGPVDAQHHLAEVYVLRGELERADRLLDELEAVVRPLDRTRSLAGAMRVRGLIAAARGDVDLAEELLRESLQVQARRPEPHESGRTLLHLGTILRRANRRRAAREALGEAARTLDACGSRVWADRARAELDRISGRPLRTGSMTATETQVAALVATGASNREVARRLSLSPKTVEWNLSKIYRKLGVRSRGELAAKLARHQAV